MRQAILKSKPLTLAQFFFSFYKGYPIRKNTSDYASPIPLTKTLWIYGKPICLLVFLMMHFYFGFTQTEPVNNETRLEQVIESIAESEESDIDNSSVLDDLTTSAEHQININMASEEELEQLGILDFRQIQNIINYRNRYGFFVSNSELAVVEGFTPEIVKSLTPFITLLLPADSTGYSPKRIYQRAMFRVKTAFPQARGYSSVSESKGSVYPGLPLSFYTRYHLEIPGKFEFGLISDHDAGEQFFKGINKLGFDYYSTFISFKSRGFIRQVTIGDFLLRVGQGVNFGAGGGLGKSVNAMGIMKSGQFVRPYTSTDENQFFRGVSTTMGRGPVKMMLFYSNKNRDANLLTDQMTGDNYFSSLQTSGYHRTLSETEDKKSVNEQLAGGYGELKLNRFRIGALFAWQQFGLPMSTGTSLYKAKSFSGRENINIGIDYQLALAHIQLFGEAGRSKSGKVGGVQGIVWHLHPQISWSAYFRCFDPGFHSFYGSSLAEGSGNHNETGLFTGLMVNPLPKVRISGYVDIYHFPWITYSTVAPSSGIDYLAQLDILLSRKLSFYLKGKYESKPQKITISKGVATDYDEMTTKLRLHAEYIVSDKLTLRTRFEYTGYAFNQLHEKGYLVFQDFIYAPFNRYKMWVRYAYFNTDGYNSRIYTFENDLLYSFSIPEFHGRGHRLYLNLKWSPSSRVTAYLKGGYTIHNGVSSWGSGNDVTPGNKRAELRGLLYLRF
jgi:hypothetical protein